VGVDLTLLPVSYETDEGDMICLHAFDLDLNAMMAPFWEMKRGRHHGKIFWPIEKVSEEAPPLGRCAVYRRAAAKQSIWLGNKR
jgi:hypothetical protein